MIGKYGDVNLGMIAYNAGPAMADAVVAGKGQVPDLTRQYIANVNNIVGTNPAGLPSPVAAALPVAGARSGVTPPTAGPAPAARRAAARPAARQP